MTSHKYTNTEETPKLFPTKSHNHSLQLKHYLKPYTCDGCKEKGFGPRYRCKKCDFDLHEHCMFPQLSPTSHEFFPNSTFHFLTTPPKGCCKDCKVLCDACRKPINGFLYHCEEENLDLHPCCRNLKRKYVIEDEEGELILNLDKKMKDKCFWCNKKSIKRGDRSNGWSYISECRKYHVHVACVTQMVMEQWKTFEGDSVNNQTKHSVHKSSTDESLAMALENVNLKEIQARAKGYGKSGNKYWRTIKVLLKTIVSIVLGDPTMVFATLFLELLG